MINFLNTKNSIQNIKTIHKISPFWMKLNDNSKTGNLSDNKPANLIKILSGQILAMAEQDNKNPIGKKLDIFT